MSKLRWGQKMAASTSHVEAVDPAIQMRAKRVEEAAEAASPERKRKRLIDGIAIACSVAVIGYLGVLMIQQRVALVEELENVDQQIAQGEDMTPEQLGQISTAAGE
ncbi:MAG: hypothetical protein ACPGO3_03320 [Magnetospiraceae bacterium]